MTNGELLKLLEGHAVAYCMDPKCAWRNHHMNRLKKRDKKHLKKRVIEAVLIDFINHVGSSQGCDLGLNSQNLGTNL
jgi:hypothetical protein